MLSPEVHSRLQLARKNEATYQPNSIVAAKLSEKVFGMFIAPAAAGKSFVMNRIVKLDNDFARVPSFTTRDPRPDDEPGMFRYSPHDDAHVNAILDQIDAREVVEYAVHSTTGRLYGSTIDDYPGAFNLLPTLSSVAGHMRTLPFKRTHTIGLVVEPEVWQEWFNERYPEMNEERARRLDEAVLSLTWLLSPNQRDYIQWVENTLIDPNSASRAIISILKNPQEENNDERISNTAQRMLDFIKSNSQLKK